MSAFTSTTSLLSAADKRHLLAERLRERASAETTIAPPTVGQKALLYLERLYPDSRAYNAVLVSKIRGKLQIRALGEAMQKIVDRHAVLRTTYRRQQGEWVQVIRGARDVDFQAIEAANTPIADLETLWLEEARRPYDLGCDSSLRVRLYSVSDKEHILVTLTHHVAFDYWSYDVFIRELRDFYQAAISGVPAQLRPLPIQFADHARNQEAMLSGGVAEQLWEYWRRELSGEIPLLQLPLDRPRPLKPRGEGATLRLAVTPDVVAKLRSLAQQRNTTLYVVFLATLHVLLKRYTGQDDIIVGSPMACRSSVETEQLIGYFANVLPLRADLSGNPPFSNFVDQMNRKVVGALEHQDFPFARLVDKLGGHRDLGRNPIVDVALAWEKSEVAERETNGGSLEIEQIYARQLGAPYDLTVFAFDRENELALMLLYNSDLFEAATIERMAAHLQTLLRSIAAEPHTSIARLPLPNDERRQLLELWNQTETEYPRTETIHRLFDREADRQPQAIAVQLGEMFLTYGQLKERSNQVANYLLKKGVQRGSLVALCVERSLEMVVGILGILKAGAAYVPLDPAYPAERLSFMLTDANVSVLLTQNHLLRSLPSFAGTICCLDSDRKILDEESTASATVEVSAEDLAYVMYTSGSTGTPKGVCVPHRAVVRLVRNTNYASFSAKEVFLQFAPICFDAATFEIWGPLLNGGRLIVYPLKPLALDDLGRCIREYGVTTLWLTAGLFQLMIENRIEDLRGVRQLLAGGDVLSVAHVEKVRRKLPECTLINGYGPTENATFTCCYTVPKSDEIKGSIPIGRPISNGRVYVLNREMQPVPIGVAGEMYVGGDGLALGYLNRSELNAERFVANPFENNSSRLYRTGDMVRYRADGNIEFLGRLDEQVKIRGFRVEPGEIEAILNRHAAVVNSAVVVNKAADGSKSLVAYVVFSDPATTTTEIGEYLSSLVPDHMVPAAFIRIDALPLTPNGKVDRRALPRPEAIAEERTEPFLEPQSELEQIISSIWQQALNAPHVGRFDNFFDLGAHSLLLAKVHEEIQQQTGTSFAIVDMFRFPTVNSLAAHISLPKDGERPVDEVRERARRQRLAISRRSVLQLRRAVHEQP
jgi:amino acid adenylation domain-containing protein